MKTLLSFVTSAAILLASSIACSDSRNMPPAQVSASTSVSTPTGAAQENLELREGIVVYLFEIDTRKVIDWPSSDFTIQHLYSIEAYVVNDSKFDRAKNVRALREHAGSSGNYIVKLDSAFEIGSLVDERKKYLGKQMFIDHSKAAAAAKQLRESAEDKVSLVLVLVEIDRKTASDIEAVASVSAEALHQGAQVVEFIKTDSKKGLVILNATAVIADVPASKLEQSEQVNLEAEARAKANAKDEERKQAKAEAITKAAAEIRIERQRLAETEPKDAQP